MEFGHKRLEFIIAYDDCSAVFCALVEQPTEAWAFVLNQRFDFHGRMCRLNSNTLLRVNCYNISEILCRLLIVKVNMALAC